MTLSPLQFDALLKSLRSLDDVRGLISKLGFTYADEPVSERNLPDKLTALFRKGSLRIIGRALNYPVVFVQANKNGKGDLDRQLIRLERLLIPKLPPEIQDACMVISAIENGASGGFARVHFVNAKRTGKRLMLRRFLTGGEHKTRTASERLALLQLTGNEEWADVLKKIEEAFDRDKVTDKFFKDFQRVFNALKKDLLAQHKDEHLAHQFLHALLNRLMFIYFVQRKRWECLADGDHEFIKTLWDTYRDGDFPMDTFYREWLSTLFFYGFNNKMSQSGAKLPPEVKRWFEDAPYLDGGLFTKKDFDSAVFTITDAMFERIFTELLDAYNFTVTEDTPFDQNIAVDPEMLGIVYESLVNTTDLSDEKAEAGIFYTPRIEVDFMCRRALVEHLAKNTSASREDLYRFVFPEDSDEQIVPVFTPKVRKEIDDALVSVTVVDPACGSGAFLVGMMQVVLELRRELWIQKGNKPDSFDDFKERRNIIEGSLYGVDVKDWAISIAELRLWLTLIEVADEKKLDLRRMKQNGEALLPKFNFKLRVGDSLVQEIAGVTIPIRSAKGNKLSTSIQNKIADLRVRKREFYENKGEITEAEIRKRETALYEAILDERIKEIDAWLSARNKDERAEFQQELGHILDKEKADEDFAKHKVKEDERRKREIEEAKAEKAQLLSIRKNLAHKKQLFWSIEFAEIFQDKGGFDIVIGNPPYVRQEKIADPFALESGKEPSVEEKRVYKEKLARMVGDDWGTLKTKGKDIPAVAIGKRADLYVYFYLRGMALLRADNDASGTFVFITSNSWLDVGYGAGLQEFLLRRARVLAIYDNEAKKTFQGAEINTVIAVLEPLAPKAKPSADHKARFVMFKTPFEDAVSSDTLLETEAADERETIKRKLNGQAVSLARVLPLTQAEIYRQGLEASDNEDKQVITKDETPFAGKYGGNKWSGKYLRAPDVYWLLLEEIGKRLRPLKDLASVKFGVKTGNNEFFFLDVVEDAVQAEPDAHRGCVFARNALGWTGWIEKKYLVPAIQRVEECSTLTFAPRKWLFVCDPKPSALAKKLIQFGESQKVHLNATCGGRKPWWALKIETLEDYQLGFNYNIYDSGWTYLSLIHPAYYSNVFHMLKAEHIKALHAYMNSSIFHFFINVLARTSLGGGKAKVEMYELAMLPVPSGIERIESNPRFDEVYRRLTKQASLKLVSREGINALADIDQLIASAIEVRSQTLDLVKDELNRLIQARLFKAVSR